MHHPNEHRHELGKQMDELILDHDQFKQKLTEQTTQSPYYPNLKQKIDQWKQQPIDKIHQVADDIRKNVDNMIETQLTDVLTKLAHEINHVRQEDEYFETDIQQCTQQLHKLFN